MASYVFTIRLPFVYYSDFPQTFFEELLKEKCIGVPGIFFDINPAHRRNLFSSPCHHFIRLSFGPPIDVLDKGLVGIFSCTEEVD